MFVRRANEGSDVATNIRFFDIAIYMYYREHQPPHFHAVYGGDEVLVTIEGLSVYAGDIPPRALGLVMEWASAHRSELMSCWQEAQAQEPLSKIEPLK